MKRASKRQKTTTTTKPKVKKSIKKSDNYLLFGLLVGIITFFSNYLYFSTYSDSIFIMPKGNLILTSLVLSVAIFYSIFKIEEKQTAIISKYLFLILLVFSIAVSFIMPDKGSSKELINLYLKLNAFQTLLIVPTTILGIISVWIHRVKMQEIVDNLFLEKEITEEKLKIKDKILKPITKLFTKTEILPTSIFFIIIGISIFTNFYKLDNFDLYSDEAQVTQGAAGYYHTGEYKQWDFVKNKTVGRNYNRARPHQFIVAQSYKIFGISTWSSRFPSALFGVLLIILSYFIGRYFIKDKWTVLLAIFSFAFYFEFLLLQRWSRMYAMLLPTYIIATYFAFRFIAEKNTLKISFLNKHFFTKYFNFNYKYLPLFLIFLYLNLYIHVNSTFLLPIILLFTIFSAFIVKEKKYIAISFLGIVLLTLQIIFPYKVGFSWFTFFDVSNSEYYSRFIFGFPFSLNTNIIFLLIGVFSFFIIKNNVFRKRYLILLLTGITAWILFSFIIKYSFSFRYISHIIPLIIFLIIGFFILISKTLYNKVIQIILSLLLIVFVLVNFNSRYDDLYVENFAAPAKTKIAYRTIVDNCKKNEIIYQHWGPSLYFNNIDSTVRKLKLWHRDLKTVIETLKNNKGCWFVWSLHNQHAMNKDIVDYCNIYFKKYHGLGVDKTNVEVYYCNDSILVDTTNFNIDRFFPYANLNLQYSYSIAFWLKVNASNVNPPLLFVNSNNNIVSLKVNSSDSTFLCYYNQDNFIESGIIADSKWHHIVWYQQGGKIGSKYGLFIDGKLSSEKKLLSEISGLIKFEFNKQFRGEIDDIRIYDFVLNKNQIEQIIKNRGVKKTEELVSDNHKFKTLFHWQKN